MKVLNTIHYFENREMIVLLRPKDPYRASLARLVAFVAFFSTEQANLMFEWHDSSPLEIMLKAGKPLLL
ncbi:hypothetical protein [Endozoicomonas sp.]|uniref:hypothetical protein n=1 Tax=Endozoicomonas sp. TaxID=1892382 RepID=UPI00383A2791